MTGDQAIAFYMFALVAAVTPGPSNVMLTAAGANAGILRGLPCFFGVVIGMSLMMFLVALGLGQLVLRSPSILQFINWGGAAFLFWLAWKIATAGPPHREAATEPVGFLGAAAFQWVNPKSWLVSTSAAATYLHADTGGALVQSSLFGALFFLAAAPSCLLWLAFGAGAKQFLGSARAFRVFNVSMGVLLAASVLLMVR